jgi:hypothetical protein
MMFDFVPNRYESLDAAEISVAHGKFGFPRKVRRERMWRDVFSMSAQKAGWLVPLTMPFSQA